MLADHESFFQGGTAQLSNQEDVPSVICRGFISLSTARFALQPEAELQGAGEAGEPARTEHQEQADVGVDERPAVPGGRRRDGGNQPHQSAEELEL